MEGVIRRDPCAAASRPYDLIVVGGGIYGAMVAFEAARRSLRPLLLERADFGQFTSWNSLRIAHGGLRYLQTLDLRRYLESVRERQWLLDHFPKLVHPLPCLMPIYERGLVRSSVFQAAFSIDRLLSRVRRGTAESSRVLPDGKLVSARETISLFPAVVERGLRAGALWFDAIIPDSQRLLVEVLRWASHYGAVVLNYVEAKELLVENGRVKGVRTKDGESGRSLDYTAPWVMNCAGPWSREVARRFHQDIPRLFHPSLAFNLFVDREPLFQVAVAVKTATSGGRTLFLHPWKGGILAGTYHGTGEISDAGPSERQLTSFLSELNAAIPGLRLALKDILRVHWGFLPVTTEGTEKLAVREILFDHGARGGPKGLLSVSGVKFTTARAVAEKALRLLCRKRGGSLPPLRSEGLPLFETPPGLREFEQMLRNNPEAAKEVVCRLLSQEAVVHLEDLMLRRTDWGSNPAAGSALTSQVCELLPWRDSRKKCEITSTEKTLLGV